ncbi:hypothetical protein [Xanthovirga aplysinae]|uniref:hypothetical protein n=1 Tax=Xanthovirga aplysinae TaxID=2529853 RepID=UPI0012BBF76F|nr:hypothetical protein [Xanthovirga aplysinae]MTI30485.1 hypothetical protein [Xanthovirga aplysinae]
MKKVSLSLIAILYCSLTYAQTRRDLNIKFMLRGHIYAHSSMEDTLAVGGFGSSDNLPKKLNSTLDFIETGLFLKIDTTKVISFAKKFNGYNFYIVNKTDSVVKLEASDSRLNVIAEAYLDKKWQPIEFLPSSWCGNSYHNVYLRNEEYWEFKVPKFDGRISTRIRYRLMIGKDKYLYSNEIMGKINRKQLTNKQGHIPDGIMDPYND